MRFHVVQELHNHVKQTITILKNKKRHKTKLIFKLIQLNQEISAY